eukprot:Clim_evm15s246 gene=Clim_evmTU15s246
MPESLIPKLSRGSSFPIVSMGSHGSDGVPSNGTPTKTDGTKRKISNSSVSSGKFRVTRKLSVRESSSGTSSLRTSLDSGVGKSSRSSDAGLRDTVSVAYGYSSATGPGRLRKTSNGEHVISAYSSFPNIDEPRPGWERPWKQNSAPQGPRYLPFYDFVNDALCNQEASLPKLAKPYKLKLDKIGDEFKKLSRDLEVEIRKTRNTVQALGNESLLGRLDEAEQTVQDLQNKQEALNDEVATAKAESETFSQKLEQFATQIKLWAQKPPEGKITLVFTDIQSSTSLWLKYSTEMSVALQLHDAIMRECIERHHGYECKTEGDAFMVAFQSARDAAEFANDVQLEMLEAEWPETILEHPSARIEVNDEGVEIFRGLRVRMGIHTGVPSNAEKNPVSGRMDYFGPCVNKSARVQGVARGGQIFISKETKEELDAENLQEAQFIEAGEYDLKGIDGKTFVYEMKHDIIRDRVFEENEKAYQIAKAPEGMVTLVSVQIDNYQLIWDDFPLLMKGGEALLHSELRAVGSKFDGYETANSGAHVLWAFATELNALEFVMAVQEVLLTVSWPPEFNVCEYTRREEEPPGNVLENGFRITQTLQCGNCESDVDPMTQKVVYRGKVMAVLDELDDIAPAGTILMTRKQYDSLKDTKRFKELNIAVRDFEELEDFEGDPDETATVQMVAEHLGHRLVQPRPTRTSLLNLADLQNAALITERGGPHKHTSATPGEADGATAPRPDGGQESDQEHFAFPDTTTPGTPPLSSPRPPLRRRNSGVGLPGPMGGLPSLPPRRRGSLTPLGSHHATAAAAAAAGYESARAGSPASILRSSHGSLRSVTRRFRTTSGNYPRLDPFEMMRSLKDKKGSYDERTERLAEQGEELMEALREVQKELQSMATELADKDPFVKALSRLKETTEKTADLQSSFLGILQEKSEVDQKVEELVEAVTKARGEVKTLQDENAELREARDKAETDLMIVSRDVEVMTVQVNEIEKQLEEMALLKQLNQEMKQQLIIAEEMNANLERTQTELETSCDQYKRAKARIAVLESELERKQKKKGIIKRIMSSGKSSKPRGSTPRAAYGSMSGVHNLPSEAIAANNGIEEDHQHSDVPSEAPANDTGSGNDHDHDQRGHQQHDQEVPVNPEQSGHIQQDI